MQEGFIRNRDFRGNMARETAHSKEKAAKIGRINGNSLSPQKERGELLTKDARYRKMGDYAPDSI
jgi:hypothetical protein